MSDRDDHLLACETEEDRRLARIIVAVLDARDVRREDERVDPKEHKADHEFIQEWRASKMRWARRMEKVKTSVLGAAALALLGAIGKALLWIGSLILAAANNPPHGGGHP